MSSPPSTAVAPSPIAVIPDPRWKGLNSFALEETTRTPPITVVLDPLDAFARRWETDAHFVGYLIQPFDPAEPFFRLNKAILPRVRERGGDVVLNYVGLDWDTEGHEPWTRETWSAFQGLLEVLLGRGDAFSLRLRGAMTSYSTRRGYRWVYRLSEPVPADEAEARVRGLIGEFRDGGLKVDPLSDWTRLFRLPRVQRG